MQETVGSAANKTGIPGFAGTGPGINKAGIMEAEIISNGPIAREIYRIVLQREDAAGIQTANMKAKPGQFINVYLRDRSMLLPRPLSVCLAEAERITLVYRVVGKGTKELSSYKEGETLKISSPLGKGYDIDAVFRALNTADAEKDDLDKVRHDASDGTGPDADRKTVALVAGGLGVPPMLELAKTIRALTGGGGRSGAGHWETGQESTGRLKSFGRFNNGTGHERVRLVSALGFQEEPFLTGELKDFCDEVHIATDSGAAGFHGNVLEMMAAEGIKADYYLSCGPKPMLKALAEYCGRINKPLQVSLEERMGCGYGACVGCTCRIMEKVEGKEVFGRKNSAESGEKTGSEEAAENAVIIKRKKVCTDGPVFFGNEVVWGE